jgi:hypothetical protein
MAPDNKLPTDVITFSMVNDAVWVSWPGRSGSVELGHSDAVTYMMRDFLAQCDLADYLASALPMVTSDF